MSLLAKNESSKATGFILICRGRDSSDNCTWRDGFSVEIDRALFQIYLSDMTIREPKGRRGKVPGDGCEFVSCGRVFRAGGTMLSEAWSSQRGHFLGEETTRREAEA